MAITLNLPSVLAAHTGGARTIEATGRTLGEAVADVAARYPALAHRLRDKEGKPYPFVNFYLRSEEHTSELQSQSNLVCRLLLEKKKTTWSTSAHQSTSRPNPAPTVSAT